MDKRPFLHVPHLRCGFQTESLYLDNCETASNPIIVEGST